MGTVLVTGASGHLGLAVVRQLAEQGVGVRAGVRETGAGPKRAAVEAAGAREIVALDVRDGAAFARAAVGVEAVFHLAATYKYHTGGAAQDREMIADSVDGVARLFDACAAAGVRRVVLTSSAVTLPLSRQREARVTEDVWRDDLSVPYFRAKVEAERAAWARAGEAGISLVALLPGAITGGTFLRGTPSTDFVLATAKGAFRMGAPESNLPVIDVEDVAEGHVRAWRQGAEGRFALVHDDIVSIREMAAMLHEMNPRYPRSLMTLPAFMAGAVPMFDALNARTLGTPRLVSPEFAASVKGRWFSFSNAKAKRELGWQPRFTVRQSIERTIAQLKAIGSL
jgi:dihydroflavonol-4-reductase